MAEVEDEAGRGGGRSPPPPDFWVMEDRVRHSIGQCYDEGVFPVEPNMGEVVEDERGRRFRVNESLDAIKEKWLKERTVIFIFQDEARNPTRGPNVVSYVARASEVATWLVQKGSTRLSLAGKDYPVAFKPWMTKPELKEIRLRDAETNFWIVALRVPLDAMYYLRSAAEGLIGGLKQMHAPEADRSRPKLMNVKIDMDPQARFKVEDTLIIESPKGEWWKVEVATPYSDWCRKCRWYFHTEENCPRQGYDRGPRWQGTPNPAQQRAPAMSEPRRAANSANGADRPIAAPQTSQASHGRGAIGTRDAVRPSQGFATSAQQDERLSNTAQARDQSVLAQYPHIMANPTFSPAPGNQSYSFQAAHPPPPPPPDRTLMPGWTNPGEWPASVYAAPHPRQWHDAPNLVQGHQDVNYCFQPAHHSNPDLFHQDTRILMPLHRGGCQKQTWIHPASNQKRRQICAMVKLKMATWNVRGLGDSSGRRKKSRIKSWVFRKQVEVLCIQETKLSEDKLRAIAGWWDGPQVWSPAQESRGGVGILLHRSLQSQVVDSEADLWGRWAWFKLQSDLTEWVLMTVYVPADPSTRAAFFRTLLPVIPHSEHLIMVGDWNVSLDEALTDGTRTAGRRDALALMDLIQDLGLSGPFRSLNPAASGYTWFSIISRERGDVTCGRLDYFLVTGGLAQGFTAIGPKLHPMSDHRSVLAEMVLTEATSS
ncbi:hypothetical protein CBR_g49654 [Chara braunii]|uniref:Endonuclease/exonuclease/phosphatase domain-containing protein n=1 Tax=Chara braunii TaxID=69332 RepID=A0A388M5P7_CHABU|nr:hypothetical protein CBR_g49654 [Chara braunii]|eukprot:GBG89803.1 hypothetical protein CBR_g49654 [Chara braunii]